MVLIRISRKPYLVFFMVIAVLFMSCEQYDAPEEVQQIENNFDYSAFEEYKNPNLKVLIPESIKNKAESEQKYQEITTIINSKLGVELKINELDKEYLSGFNSKSVSILHNDRYFNSTDRTLIYDFQKDLEKESFNVALLNFEKNVLELNLEEKNFKKYNAFANILKLINAHESTMFNENKKKFLSKTMDDSCQDAVISYAFATLGLASCGSVPILCYFAIANKVRTFKNMIKNCKK